MAKLIAICGPDKVGKETQSRMLTARLRELGYKVALVEVPVHDVITYSVIYRMLKNGSAKKFPNVFQYIQYLNKRIFQEFVMKDLDEDNDFIVLDRWKLSAKIYGFATGADPIRIEEQCKALRDPELTIVLTGVSHIERLDDTYEADKQLQPAVRFLYKQWANCNPELCVEINCNEQRSIVHEKIIDALKLKFPRYKFLELK